MNKSPEAPERIWLVQLHPDLPVLRSVDGGIMHAACEARTSERDIEYRLVHPNTTSDIAERDAALEEAARIADGFHISNNFSGHWQNGAAMASTAIRDLIRARKSTSVSASELASGQQADADDEGK